MKVLFSSRNLKMVQQNTCREIEKQSIFVYRNVIVEEGCECAMLIQAGTMQTQLLVSGCLQKDGNFTGVRIGYYPDR